MTVIAAHHRRGTSPASTSDVVVRPGRLLDSLSLPARRRDRVRFRMDVVVAVFTSISSVEAVPEMCRRIPTLAARHPRTAGRMCSAELSRIVGRHRCDLPDWDWQLPANRQSRNLPWRWSPECETLQSPATREEAHSVRAFPV